MHVDNAGRRRGLMMPVMRRRCVAAVVVRGAFADWSLRARLMRRAESEPLYMVVVYAGRVYEISG